MCLNKRGETDFYQSYCSLSFVYTCVQLREITMRLSVNVFPHVCTSYLCLCLISFLTERHKGRGSMYSPIKVIRKDSGGKETL